MIHPETGEVLETREQFQAALAKIDQHLDTIAGPIFRMRREIRKEYYELHPPAEMPPARSRTQVQERVARCPRCGQRMESEEAAK